MRNKANSRRAGEAAVPFFHRCSVPGPSRSCRTKPIVAGRSELGAHRQTWDSPPGIYCAKQSQFAPGWAEMDAERPSTGTEAFIALWVPAGRGTERAKQSQLPCKDYRSRRPAGLRRNKANLRPSGRSDGPSIRDRTPATPPRSAAVKKRLRRWRRWRTIPRLDWGF